MSELNEGWNLRDEEVAVLICHGRYGEYHAVAIDVDTVGAASIIVVQYSRWGNTIVLITRCGSRFKCRTHGYQSFASAQRWTVSARYGLAFTDVPYECFLELEIPAR